MKYKKIPKPKSIGEKRREKEKLRRLKYIYSKRNKEKSKPQRMVFDIGLAKRVMLWIKDIVLRQDV